MTVAASSSSSAPSSAIWGQLQQQQAQRVADQAEQNARALQQKARQAEGDASRAQERARIVRVESDQADRGADSAKQTLASMDSASQMYQDLGRRVSAVNTRLSAETKTATTDAAPVAASTGLAVASSASAAVGSNINVTA